MAVTTTDLVTQLVNKAAEAAGQGRDDDAVKELRALAAGDSAALDAAMDRTWQGEGTMDQRLLPFNLLARARFE